MAGAFMRNVQVRAISPASGSTNTSGTVQFQAMLLDPLRRGGAIIFQVDRSVRYDSSYAQTSSAVSGIGWADTPISWVSAAMVNGEYWWQARSSLVKVGAGPSLPNGRLSQPAISFLQSGGAGVPRALYLYANRGIQSRVPAVGDNARALYLYANRGVRNYIDGPTARALFLYLNRAHTRPVLARGLYVQVNSRDSEVFPYLSHLSPVEQYVGGQVDLYGDGFGQFLEARSGAILTSSTIFSGNVAENIRDGTSAEFWSSLGASSWIRFTWGAAKRIVAVALEGVTANPIANAWGVPQFRFDDASTQDGGAAIEQVFAAGRSGEYPVGWQRQVFWLATPKVSTYLEIGIASGGIGTNRGLSEAWILEEISPAQNAETARAVLNLGLPSELNMGIVAWQNRSPNWYPANSGVPPLPAATVTVPVGAVSGLVYVEEQT